MVNIDSNGVSIFSLTLHWSAIFTVVGGWVAAEIAAQIAAWQLKQNPAYPVRLLHIWRGLLWIVISGLIGARLWFVLFPPASYVAHGFTAGWILTHFFDLNQGAIALWAGGVGVFGALIGGALGLLFYLRLNHLPLLPYFDLAALVLPLAQAISRVGNGLRQDMYGSPIDAAWGMLISDASQRVAPYTDFTRFPLATTRFHPLYLYELIALTIIFIISLIIYYRQHGSGVTLLSYVALYGLVAFLIEFLRVDSSSIAGINISQLTAAVMVLVAGIGWYRSRRRLRSSNSSS
jgi:phosphatidylglycerol---prolipoprotein diacylglyceryl transferase